MNPINSGSHRLKFGSTWLRVALFGRGMICGVQSAFRSGTPCLGTNGDFGLQDKNTIAFEPPKYPCATASVEGVVLTYMFGLHES